MRDQMASRLVELREDFQEGQAHLAELEVQASALRETLLRLSGAVQVIDELLAGDTARSDPLAREPLQARLVELRGDFQKGQGRLRELEMEQAVLHETLLRISGAIQVLEELLQDAVPQGGTDASG